MTPDQLSLTQLREWLADLYVFDLLTGDPCDPRDLGNDVWLEYARYMDGVTEGWGAPQDLQDEFLDAFTEATYEKRPACEGCRTRSTETDRHNCLPDEL